MFPNAQANDQDEITSDLSGVRTDTIQYASSVCVKKACRRMVTRPPAIKVSLVVYNVFAMCAVFYWWWKYAINLIVYTLTKTSSHLTSNKENTYIN